MRSSQDSSNLFHRGDVNDEYCNNYVAARPVYDQTFYDLIWAYHAGHSGKLLQAIDVGTGPGQVAAELSKLFDTTIASDNNKSHLAVAAHRLRSLIDARKIQLAECSAEDIAILSAPKSVDIITAAECLPLIDAKKALYDFARVLKPGGTLAIWFYGRPAFAEAEYFDKCQPLLDTILNSLFADEIIKSGSPQHRIGWKRATDRMASYLDDVRLDQHIWTDVQRMKWNTNFPMSFYDPEACDFEVERTSAMNADEESTEIKDFSFWERQWNIDQVKRFVLANLPTFSQKLQETEEVQALYEELGKAMGGRRAVRQITWPVVAILATKR